MTMPTLSEPTVGVLVQVAADERTYDQLVTILLRADLTAERYGYGGDNEHNLVRNRLLRARSLALQGDREAHHSLLIFVRTLVQQAVPDPYHPPRWFAELCESLLADGYQLTWENWSEFDSLLSDSSNYPIYRIMPTDSGPVPLAGEISALERDLDLRGYTLAIEPYRQAVINFGQHQYEVTNMALRTALEALVMELATDHANFGGQGNQGQGGAAINHLIDTGALKKRDGGHMLQGLWQMIQTNGPHPGRSSADEARMRMQLVTATARFLLNHFPV